MSFKKHLEIFVSDKHKINTKDKHNADGFVTLTEYFHKRNFTTLKLSIIYF